MYPVSEAYLNTLHSGLIDCSVFGTIQLKNGQVIQITEKDIIPDSFSIDNKAINDNDFGFGGVYVGRLSITLFKDIDRYSLYDAEVKFSYFLNCSDGSREEIPLGIFYVDDPKRTKKLISLVCYDSMVKFDKEITDITKGFAYDILNMICSVCDVPLKNTQEEIEQFPNSRIELTVDPEQVKTYHELLYYVCQILGVFATIDREGNLVLKQFQTEPCRTIHAGQRTSSTVADYETYFNAVKGRFLAESNFYPYIETDPDTEGLTLDIGDIPIVDNNETVKHQMLKDLIEVVKGIRYVPSDVNTFSDPSIDLGDCLELEQVNNTDTSVKTIVTSYVWRFHNTQRIQSVGSDAKLKNITSPNNSLITEIEGIVSKKNLVVYSYTNAGELNISDLEMTVIVIPFVMNESGRPLFMATIPFNMDVDGNVIIRYYMDGALLQEDTLTEYLLAGKHFLTISNSFFIDSARICRLVVTMQTQKVVSDKRMTDAKINAILDNIQNGTEIGEFVPDETVPKLKIEKLTIRCVLFGQGLGTVVPWDGTLNFADTVETFVIEQNEIVFGSVSESINFVHDVRNDATISDLYEGFDLSSQYDFNGFNETVDVSSVIERYILETLKYQNYDFDLEKMEHNGTFELNQNYFYESAEEEIDSGRMTSLKIVTSDKQSVESVVIAIE